MDDDVPPPLHSLADQVQALSTSAGPISDADLPVAAVTLVPGTTSISQQRYLKKGFLDAKPHKRRPAAPTPRTAGAAASSSTQQPDMPFITARGGSASSSGAGGGVAAAGAGRGAAAIPDFMRLEPSEQEKQYMAFRSKLVDVLKPTQDTIQQVASDPLLTSGFDDPEVMAAVAEVARDPQSIKKYKNNRKVQQFYAAMGKLMGSKLEGMAASS